MDIYIPLYKIDHVCLLIYKETSGPEAKKSKKSDGAQAEKIPDSKKSKKSDGAQAEKIPDSKKRMNSDGAQAEKTPDAKKSKKSDGAQAEKTSTSKDIVSLQLSSLYIYEY